MRTLSSHANGFGARFIASVLLSVMIAPGGFVQNVAAQNAAPQAPATPQQPINTRQGPAAPPPPPREVPLNQKGTIRSAVDLVQVDVEVVDGDGKPIKGLRQDQFSVSEDGHDQKIASFDFNDVEKIEKAEAVDSTPVTIPIGTVSQPDQIRQVVRDRRLMVLFFDLTSLQIQDLRRTSDAAKAFLKTQMTAADLVGVVVFGNQLKVVADFTNDRDLLDQAVDALLPGKESQLASLAAASAQGVEDAVTEDTDAAFTADDTEFNVFNTDRKLQAIESMCDLLKDIPGKKSLIQFTSGITQTGEDNRSQLQATTNAANRANVNLYTVDSRGLMAETPGGDASSGAASGNSNFSGASVFHQTDSRQDSRDTLATLATDTGGRSFFDLGDLGKAFQAVQDDTAGYYLVGYYSTNPARDGRWRTIHVRVTGVPNAHVRFRDGYYAPKDFGVYTTEDRERQLEEAMSSDAPVNELPIAVETSYFRVDNRQVFVPISAKLASSALQWAEKSGRREVSFDFAYEVRDAQTKRPVGAQRDTITVRLDTERYQQVQQNALVYQGGIILAPGNYKLKFLARENESGRIGTFEDDLKIPATVPDKLQLSSVVLSSQLVEDQKTGEVQTKGFAAETKVKASPLDVGGERIVPSVTRVFTNQQDLYIFFQAYVPPSVDASRLRAGVEFFRNGTHVNQTPMVAPSEVDDKTHTASFRVSVPLADVAAGRYTVQAIVVEGSGAQAVFGRNFFALQPPPKPVGPATPAAPDSTTPPAPAAPGAE